MFDTLARQNIWYPCCQAAIGLLSKLQYVTKLRFTLIIAITRREITGNETGSNMKLESDTILLTCAVSCVESGARKHFWLYFIFFIKLQLKRNTSEGLYLPTNQMILFVLFSGGEEAQLSRKVTP